jgi:hypothetical protein
MITKMYTVLWNKYRPAVLQMMLAANTGPQQYKLSAHEFRQLNPKEKGGYGFTLLASKGKALNNIKRWAVAQDLLEVLQQSKKASELMSESPYELILDKQFVLHVNKKEEQVVIKKEEPVIDKEEAVSDDAAVIS